MKTWFITGAGRGLGKAFTEAALQRGDRVAATARKTTDLAPLAARFKDTLLPLELDVTDSAAATATVRNAFEQRRG
jgi:NADP-dependent 3-hydroxy acid dehydrogenase YdfG